MGKEQLMGKTSEIAAVIGYAVFSLIFILITVLGLKEFVVSVCCLLILETGMAVLLHKSELWKHGLMLAAQFLAGILIGRIPLVIICMIVYIVAAIILHFTAKK